LRDADEGAVHFEGRALDRAARREANRAIQIVFQDPFSALDPRMPVSAIIAEPLRINGIGTKQERAARAAELVTQVGLPVDSLNRYPHEFSGGQRQRIAIARAMVLKPRFVVLDEPTSALDMSVQAQIVDLLRKLQDRHGLGYLFISHDLKVVRALAHRLIVLRHGEVVEEGTAAQVFSNPRQAYTRDLMAAAFKLAAPASEEEEDDEVEVL
jgi:ABC-type microcin C transport system duplicated ATPase subunit YejF